MKFNFKKISAVIAGALVTGMTLGTAAAATYPTPFVEDGQANTAIVYGSDALSSDQVSAGNLQTDLQEELDETTSKPSTSSGLGDDYSLVMDDLALDVSFADSLGDRDDELPTVLAEGTLKDGSVDYGEEEEIDYEQELTYKGKVRFSALNDDEYAVNTDLADDELPVLNIDHSSMEAYNLTVSFDDTINATAYEDSESLEIVKKELTFNPQTTLSDGELSFFEGKETVEVSSAKDSTTSGDDTIEVVGGSEDGGSDNDPTIDLKINGNTEYGLEEGDEVGDYYVKSISVNTFGEVDSVSARLFAGSKEWVIDDFDAFTDVEVDGEDLEGVQAYVTTSSGTGNAGEIDSITFQVNPSDMDADEKSYLEVGEELVDPLFGTFKMLFDSVDPELKADSKGSIGVDVSSGAAELSFTTIGGDEGSISPLEINDDDNGVIKGEDWYTGADYTGVKEDEIFITSEGVNEEEETSIWQIKNIDAGDDTGGDEEIEFKNVLTGDIEKIDDNEELMDTGLKVADFDQDSDVSGGINLVDADTGAVVSVKNEIITQNGMSINLIKNGVKVDASTGTDSDTLGITDGTVNPSYTFNSGVDATGVDDIYNNASTLVEELQDDDLSAYAFGNYVVTGEYNDWTFSAGGDISASAYNGYMIGEDADASDINLEEGTARGGISAEVAIDEEDDELKLIRGYSDAFQSATDSGDTDKEFALSELGTYVEAGTDENYYLDVWTPTEQTLYNVYFSEIGGTTTPEEETGVMLVKDSEISSVDDKNLIVVGGSCVNTAAASLLGVEYKTCGTDFTEAAGVGSGEALIKGYSDSDLTSEHAVLVAGYEGTDTQNAAKYLRNEYPDTSEAHKVTSATSATVLSSSA